MQDWVFRLGHQHQTHVPYVLLFTFLAGPKVFGLDLNFLDMGERQISVLKSLSASTSNVFGPNQIITIWDLQKDRAEKNLLDLLFPCPGINYTESSISYSFIFQSNFRLRYHLKGQQISKQNCCAVTSPKEQTNEFVFLS